ncbi:hypothetical protein ACHAW5_001455 [Stephanodiscus triporus]|uniref:Plastid lipid-associated protein/fibrillin conserved domain-containing protein n=1 Tax=Stephanodiscus triporus TaxID=2934178 RepID=A0ABD3N5Y0_9STRA
MSQSGQGGASLICSFHYFLVSTLSSIPIMVASSSSELSARRRILTPERGLSTTYRRRSACPLGPLITLAILCPASSLLPTAARPRSAPSPLRASRRREVSIAEPYDNDAATLAELTELLEEKRVVQLLRRGMQEPKSLIGLLRGAGAYGVIAFALVYVVFYGTAGTLAELSYHCLSGGWVDPRMLLLEDGADGKAETLALLAAFYLACKPFAPLKLGGALLITPDVERFVSQQKQRPAIVALGEAVRAVVGPATAAVESAGAAVYRKVAPARLRAAILKSELLSLAEKAEAGVVPLGRADRSRLDEIALVELPALRPMAEPARSDLFTGEWELRWTDELEINFVVERGLFGLPWTRTYQTIDVRCGRLENVIEFDGGELRVGSSIVPDPTDGARFNFVFDECTLRWREISVPLPPVGRGWGELLYLDEEMRIQRDIRGDLLVATRVLA